MKRRGNGFGMTGVVSIVLGKTPEAFGEEKLAMPVSQRRCWELGIAIALGISGAISQSGDRALAQSTIVPDRTLGNENSVVVPNFQGLPMEAIGGGAVRGQNLFHSFREFNVSTGRGAYFFSPSGNIQNILTRVTGNNPSQILGTLGTFGNSQPNLFLINPNGIIFGPNASLDIGGSFVATTANAIRLGNTGLFSASHPGTSNLLSINPSAFFFNAHASQAQIVNRSTATSTVLGDSTIGLQVPDGRSLLLVGGDVKLDGGSLFARGGRVELGGVAGTGTVGLNAFGNELRLSFPTDVARADVALTNQSEVNVRAGGGGSIAINARNLEILQGSKVRAGIGSRLGSADSKAGNIDINATGTTTIAGKLSFIANVVLPEGVGKAGDINLTTGSLFVKEGGYFNSSTQGQGDAGNVTILARDTVSFDGTDPNGGTSGAFSTVQEGGVGNGGNIDITTGSLFVTNGAQLVASTAGQGNAGSVRIRASDTARFDKGDATSSVAKGAMGDGSNIEINTGSLEVTNGASLSASSAGQGNAGSVKIRATDTVSFDGGNATSSVTKGAVGNGGDIDITTGSLKLTNSAFLSAGTDGQGNAGSVRIRATDTVSFDGDGGAGSAVDSEAVGNGGDIVISTGSLSVSKGASLFAASSGQGNAGSVRINANNIVRFDGGNAYSAVAKGAMGNGGDIDITTGSLKVTNGAFLSAGTYGQGEAGRVRLSATDSMSFDGSGTLSAVGSEAVGNGGDVVISTGSLFLSNGAQLIANTYGQGNAGNIKIMATDQVRFAGVGSNGLNSGAFSAVGEGAQGKGGSIDITSRSLSLTDAFISSVSLGTGKAGDIKLQTHQNLETNRSQILATTQAGDGGNIRLQVGDVLLMRNGSKISTTAGIAGAGGNGGNININADFVAAVSTENSDITAKAYNGRGGNINITTQGIYGLEYRQRETPLSDITASSQFGVNGEFQLELLTNVDPSRGLTELPTDVVDATRQIDRRCTAIGIGQERSSFTITGRGGLPPSPNDPLQGEGVVTHWVSLNSDRENNTPPAKTMPSTSAPRQLVEAQGWIINENGKVVLTASAPKVTPRSEWLSPPECNSSQKVKAPQS